jgi:2-methylcitrate dehydratase PrpD
MSTTSLTYTAAITEELRRRSTVPLNQGAIQLAQLSILDTFGCMVVGAPDPGSRSIRKSVATSAELTGSLVGFSSRSMPTDAALVNGSSGHAFDYDDYDDLITSSHPSTVLLPAAFAVVQDRHLNGEDLVRAYVSGWEAMQAFGLLLGPNHYRQGFHSTGTLGALGAAVAAGTAMQLDAEQMTTSIAIAISMMAGLRVNFGTNVKPLHAGRAASSGVLAALLAEDGFTASDQAVEGPSGFLSVYGSDESIRSADFQEWLAGKVTIETHRPSIKLFPSCGCTHSSIDGLLRLKESLDIEADSVKAVEIQGPSIFQAVLLHHSPHTGLEAKFSMEGCAGLALVDGRVGLAQFSDDSVERPEVQRLIDRTTLTINDRLDTRHRFEEGGLGAIVTIVTDSGRHELEVLEAPGSPPRPLDIDSVRDKFRSCVNGLLDDSASETVISIVGALTEHPEIDSLARTLESAGSR